MYTLIRTGAFQGFAQLVVDLGGDPQSIYCEAGVDEALLDVSEALIPSGQFIHCLRLAAQQTGRVDFGLLLSTRQDSSMLGAIGLLAEMEESLFDNIEVIRRFLRLHNSSAIVELQQYNNKLLLTYDDMAPGFIRDTQICDFAMGFALRIARVSLGEEWSPKSVYFGHKKPKDSSTFEKIFNCPLFFDQEVYGVEFDRSALNVPQPTADKIKRTHLMRHIERLQEEMRAQEQNANTVGYLIHSLLPSGECNETGVAALLGITPRTLQRRLKQEGTSFNQLLNNIRVDLAKQYLTESKIPLTTMSSYLGYSELSAFSRFFKERQGCSPSQYRKQAG